ncbi:fibronectin type III domain-containing protein [Gemmatimonadota bacterium]
MAKFPRREADIAALAGTMVFGLAENAEDFPDCPVTVERLQEALSRYNRAKETAATADGAAAEAYEEKAEAVQVLTDQMKNVVRYAEIAVGQDEAKLKNIGWSGRRDPVQLLPPGAPRTLEIKREGKGWVYLDWKTPAEGGTVSAYRVLTRTSGATEWAELVLCFESMTVLTEQPQGVDLEFQVVAINKAGVSLPSNLVTVSL